MVGEKDLVTGHDRDQSLGITEVDAVVDPAGNQIETVTVIPSIQGANRYIFHSKAASGHGAAPHLWDGTSLEPKAQLRTLGAEEMGS